MLLNCLEHISRRELKGAEVIVVEAADLPEPAEADAVKYLKIPSGEAGFSRQRNLGIKNASGEYIIFIDDDIEITDGWFDALTRYTLVPDGSAGAIGATFPHVNGASLISFSEGVMGHPGGGFRLHALSDNKDLVLSQISTCNTILKKSIVEAAGGFDERTIFGSEDTDLSMRITEKLGGGKFRYLPGALVWHYSKTRYSDMCAWYFRRGRADADLLRHHSVHLSYFISTAVSIKIVFVAAGSYIFGLWFAPVSFFLWYFVQLFRTGFMFNYFYLYDFTRTKRMAALFCFPLIKLSADLMFDLGRAKGLCGGIRGEG